MSTIQTIIVSAEPDRLQAFYQSLLGAREVKRFKDFYVWLTVGDSDLGIVSDDKAEPGPGSRFVISVAVDDVDALLPRVEELGGTVLGPPNDMPWGQRVAHIQDPDGNAVNLTAPVP